MKKFCLFCLSVFLIGSIASCDKSTAAAVGNMIGIWSRNVNGVDYRLYITDSTHFSYNATINGTPFLASGTYIMGIGQATFKETSSASYCPNVLGTYTFANDGTTLTLTAGTDNCSGGFATRPAIFTGDWIKN